MTKREAKKLAAWFAAQGLRGELAGGWNPGQDRGLSEADQDLIYDGLAELVSELERRGSTPPPLAHGEDS